MEGPSPSVAGSSQLSSMALNSSKKLALGLGVASVAAGAGSVAVQAGPALQTLNNITNTAEFTINNTYGQSFSVDGRVTTALAPFANMVDPSGTSFGPNFTSSVKCDKGSLIFLAIFSSRFDSVNNLVHL